MMIKVFIDGKEGTTGLQIYDRLGRRDDIQLITLPEELRKNVEARRECLNSADVCFLCLPDAAAIEAVQLVTNPKTKIIDASTAHRTNADWVYGLPELSDKRREEIKNSNRVANPGCYATGFITLVEPLVKAGIVSSDYPFVVHAVSGYSGAGKKAIAQYESADRDIELSSPREYALSLSHKHIPEMVRECGLTQKPIFNPYVCDYYCGMCVTVPLFTRLLSKKCTVDTIREYFAEYYVRQNFINIVSSDDMPQFLAANKLAGTNMLNIYVTGNDEQILLASVFDNLGKGASGAAVQNMNIMFGLDECVSLV
ncbi:MAG: N-acetyl-gamma-glutamyl-phosphate reductase [Clostridia bacterium]|nr:N-acetyl-gamma-glutamyl-phosphate reductase [Clostridia bacterium]